MTRKDFELIARTISAFCDGRPDVPRDELAMAFGHELAETNPRFNLERFLRSCGL
jgi:hypothetical protein